MAAEFDIPVVKKSTSKASPDIDGLSLLTEAFLFCSTSASASSVHEKQNSANMSSNNSMHRNSLESVNEGYSTKSQATGMETRRNTGPSHPSQVVSSWRKAAVGHSSDSFTSGNNSPAGLHGVAEGFFTPQQLNNAYSYAYYRGNGVYTRLIPADDLPCLTGLSQTQGDSTGLIILPAPRGTAPPAHLFPSSPMVATTQQPCAQTMSPVIDIQHRIDTIVASTPPKRNKIFCSKWVHDGTCAFTQTGCRYKHEMPMDVTTQRELGLFNGLPSWWKRQQGIDFRLSTPRTVSSTTAPVGSGRPGLFPNFLQATKTHHHTEADSLPAPQIDFGQLHSAPGQISPQGPIARPILLSGVGGLRRPTSFVPSSPGVVDSRGKNPYEMLPAAFEDNEEWY